MNASKFSLPGGSVRLLTITLFAALTLLTLPQMTRSGSRTGAFTASAAQSNRSLIKTSASSTVYWLQNNRIYGIINGNVVTTMQNAGVPGWNWSSVFTVSSLASFTRGPDFISTATSSNGLLVKRYQDSAVYLIANGRKEFLSLEEFNRRGFNFANVIDVAQAILDMFPTVPTPNFAISASPSSRTVTRGQSATYTITVQNLNGFNSGVILSALNLPGAGFSPQTVVPPPNGSANSTLTIVTNSQTPTGSSTITIQGLGNGITRSATINLTVTSEDTIKPVIGFFDVAPRSLAFGQATTISYRVSDSGGAGLKRIELWRTTDRNGSPDSAAWAKIKETPLSGNGPIVSSFVDAPPAGTFWYGLHAVDNRDNFGIEPDPPGPIRVTISTSDGIEPVITNFNVSPRLLNAGQRTTISFTVSDSGGSGLDRIELWRTRDRNGSPDDTAWVEIKRILLQGNGPTSNFFTDNPPSGMVWYGLHAVDKAGKVGHEPSSPGPIKVTINSYQLVTWISHGFQDPFEHDTPPGWTTTMAQTIASKTGQPAFAFSWVRQSNNTGAGWAEAAGEQLASRIMSYDPNKQHNHHLIGHSLGSVVVSEAARRLRAENYKVVQMTLLDPVDGEVDRLYINWRRNPEVHSWEGITRVDSYWGNGETDWGIQLKGHPVNGAINTHITEGNHSKHKGVHEYYQETIGNVAYDNTSTSYTDANGSVISAPGFCKVSNNRFCRGGWYWSPNGGGWTDGAPGEGKTIRSIVSATPLLFNGNFEQPQEKSGNSRTWAGYEWHTQSGNFTNVVGHSNALLEKLPNSNNHAAFLGVVAAPTHLEHAPVFVPRGPATLKFDYWVESVGFWGRFVLKVNNQEIPLGALERTNGFQAREVDISAYTGQLVSIRFEGDSVGVWLDNLRIELQANPRHTLTINPSPQNGKITGQGIDCGAGGSGDCSESYTSGLSVELTAVPANGYQVGQWTGCQSVNGVRCTVQITQARTVSVTFINSSSCFASVSSNRWKGEYFANRNLSGAPAMVRDEGANSLNFDWGIGGPSSACGLGVDNFSARWTRTINFAAGTYRFTAAGDDGIRLYVDGVLKINQWRDQAETAYSVDVSLSAGNHELRLEFYDNGGNAVARLSFAALSSATQQLLLNPGFEGGATGWTAATVGGSFNTIAQAGSEARAGSWVAWFNGEGRETTYTLSQVVNIPSSATTATLSFWLRIYTAEYPDAIYDKLSVEIRNEAGTVILTTLATYSNLDSGPSWVLRTFDLSAFRGQRVRIYFKGLEDFSMLTSFFVDDTSLAIR